MLPKYRRIDTTVITDANAYIEFSNNVNRGGINNKLYTAHGYTIRGHLEIHQCIMKEGFDKKFYTVMNYLEGTMEQAVTEERLAEYLREQDLTSAIDFVVKYLNRHYTDNENPHVFSSLEECMEAEEISPDDPNVTAFDFTFSYEFDADSHVYLVKNAYFKEGDYFKIAPQLIDVPFNNDIEYFFELLEKFVAEIRTYKRI